MAHNLREKYIEPMAKGEKARHTHKRADSGYAGTASDRSSRRHSGGSRRSTESTNGSRGYAEPEVSISQRFDPGALQNALDASYETIEKLEKDVDELDNALARSNSENRRLRRERDAERMQNDELRVNFERQRKELAKYQKDVKKSSSKSSSKESTWKEMPVPLYRATTPPPMPEMPRTSRPPTSNSRPTTQRRMSMQSSTPSTYTYPLRPANYVPYPGQYPS